MASLSKANIPARMVTLCNFLFSRFFFLCLLVAGVMLRVAHYLENRSFWLDEAASAVSIVNRSWLEIVRHADLSDHIPRHPYIFDLLQKTMVSFFGNYE